MARHTSTPGQRARLYLEAHRDARMTALPGEHKQAREDIMRQLEHQDPQVRDRALVGGDRHFDRPLTKPEKAYQQHWRREEGVDVGQAQDRARHLDDPTHAGRRRPAAPPRPTPTKPTPRGRQAPRARQALRYVQRTAATAGTVTPAPAQAGIGLLVGALTAGVAFSMLYLLLTKTSAISGLINLAGTSFRHLASPNTTLFSAAGVGAASSSSLYGAALNSYLAAPAPAPAPSPTTGGPLNLSSNPFGAAPAPAGVGAKVKAPAGKPSGLSGPSVNQAAAAQGLHYDPASGQYVP